MTKNNNASTYSSYKTGGIVMRKLTMNVLVPAITAGVIYKYRYKILNQALNIPFVRKMGVNTAMKIPGVREQFIQKAFGK